MSVRTGDYLAHEDEIPIMHRTCAISRWRAWLLLVIACVAVVGNFAPWLRLLPDPKATSLHGQSSARGDRENSMFPAGPQSWENESDIPLHGGLNNSVSACLLVMDDNHRLVEWIAYHYFVMPLRHLILLPDSKSRTSPMEIVQRWKPYMSIDVWNDDDMMTDALREFAKSKENSSDPGDGFLVHTHRQETFYKQCAVHLQAKQRTWTIFSDVDEYWVISEDVVPDFDVRMQTSGAILNLLDKIRQVDHPNADIYKGQSIIFSSPKGFYSRLLAHVLQFLLCQTSGNCITTYRTLFGTVESTTSEISHNVPTDIVNPKQFDTLRYRYHQKYENNQHGKAMADVSSIERLASRGFHGGLNGTRRVSLHRFMPFCRPPTYYPRALIRIHHYLGSWEAYSFRQDRRKGGDKNRQVWEEQAAVQGECCSLLNKWVVSVRL
jgi:hypothetical protein